MPFQWDHPNSFVWQCSLGMSVVGKTSSWVVDSRLSALSSEAEQSIVVGAYKSARIDNRVCIDKPRTFRVRMVFG